MRMDGAHLCPGWCSTEGVWQESWDRTGFQGSSGIGQGRSPAVFPETLDTCLLFSFQVQVFPLFVLSS